MKIVKSHLLAVSIIILSLLGATRGVSQEMPPSPEHGDIGCIQGTVICESLSDSSPHPLCCGYGEPHSSRKGAAIRGH